MGGLVSHMDDRSGLITWDEGAEHFITSWTRQAKASLRTGARRRRVWPRPRIQEGYLPRRVQPRP